MQNLSYCQPVHIHWLASAFHAVECSASDSSPSPLQVALEYSGHTRVLKALGVIYFLLEKLQHERVEREGKESFIFLFLLLIPKPSIN